LSGIRLKKLVDSVTYIYQITNQTVTNEVRFFDTTNHTSVQARFYQRSDPPCRLRALLGEFAVVLDVLPSVDRDLPTPGSGAGYHPSEYIFPLILMLNHGRRSLEDIRKIRADEGLREIVPLKRIPSSDAVGDWLRNRGANHLKVILILDR
jgi:hypothetical protein